MKGIVSGFEDDDKNRPLRRETATLEAHRQGKKGLPVTERYATGRWLTTQDRERMGADIGSIV